MSVTDTDFGYDDLMAVLEGLGDDPFILAGVRQAKGAETQEGDDITLVEIASVNEFGNIDQKADGAIPPRPFMRSTMDEKRDEYAEDMADIIRNAISGKRTVAKGFQRLGLKVVTDIQRKIKSNDFQKNADSTIAAKGGGEVKPLIDTGRLRQSIDFEFSGAA